MAFQQQAGLSNGGAGGGPGEHNGPQGTEYTLQGVMRFLQMEWHNHERARNTWDIERAEMRAKVAKQEGELLQNRRINGQLERQVKMLEMALKKERSKNQGANGVTATTVGTAGENGEQNDVKAKKESENANNGHKAKPTYVPHNSFLEAGDSDTSEKEREKYMDETTRYLKSCMKEIQYLLTPPSHPPPPQMLPNGNFTGLPEPPMVEDIYARQQSRSSRHQSLPQQQLPAPNHQPPPPPSNLPQLPSQHELGQRDARYTEYQNSQQHSAEGMQQTPQHVSAPFEDHVEKVTHTFDNRGRPVNVIEVSQEMQRGAVEGAKQQGQADTDGWTFDEDNSAQSLNPAPDGPPPRRPDTDLFPSAANANQLPAKSPPRTAANPHRRKSSGAGSMSRRKSSQGKNEVQDGSGTISLDDPTQFKVKFALRGHLDVVRSVIFSGGGSPSEPEVCTAGDDGTIKRWIVPATYQNFMPGNNNPDLDIQAYFTHRGHDGIVTCLAAPPASTGLSTGGRNNGEGWIFSGGQDHNICVWERGRVDPKAVIEGHTDTIWAICVLPASVGVVFGPQSGNFGGPDRLLLVSGSADGTVKVWAVTAPPQSSSPSTGSRRGVGGSRRHSVTSGSNYPTSPQPSVASSTPFTYTLIHSIERPGDNMVSPTSVCPLSPSGDTFVVSYQDSSCLIFDTRSGEEVVGMASQETYDGTMNTSINAVIAASNTIEGSDVSRTLEAEEAGGPTGSREGIEGVVITGHEDRYIRFFDANSGQCTYTMVAHAGAISALSLSKDGREAVSAGHDASIRFWSLEKRQCTQDIISHRAMRGEGVCDICWSQDGRLVVSAGGDGVVKVFAR